MALVAAYGVLIPIECQDWAFIGSNRMIAMVERIEKRINPKIRLLGFVINKYKPIRALERDYNRALREQYGEKIFKTEFRDHVQYVEASAERLPITHHQPHSEQAQAYREFIKELLTHG